MMSRLERLFGIRESGSTPKREALAGMTTFLAMAYIIFVNPAVLSQAGMDFGAVFTATCLSAAIATLLMALVANYPIALAPGMGQNFFFVTVVAGMQVPWSQALAAVFLSGVIFLALTLTRARSRLIEAIPGSLKVAIAAGIGLFIALIGLINAGVVRRSPAGLSLGDMTSAPVLLAFFGLAVTAALASRGFRGALLAGIAAATAAAAALGLVRFQGIFGMPPSLAPTFLKLDLPGALTWEMAPVVIIFLYTAMFDAIGTLVAVGERAGLLRDGRLVRGERALLADASGTVVGAALGTSTVTAYVESAAGVEEGGRTGLAGVVTASLFLLALAASPLVGMVGGGVGAEGAPPLHPITAPALILVGAMMARGVTRIPWDDLTESLPAFLVLAGIPFTFSIADGIALGFMVYPILKVLAGRGRQVPWIVFLLGALFAARFLVAL